MRRQKNVGQKNVRGQGVASTLASSIFLPKIFLPAHSFSPSQNPKSKIQNHSGSALRTKVALALALTLAGGCLPELARAQTLDPTRSERMQVFERVWQSVNERYYDRTLHGVDWIEQLHKFRPVVDQAKSREELYRILRRMVSLLGDSHTRVFAPEDGFDRNRPAGISTGVVVRRVEGLPIITWVDPASEGGKQGLRPGMRLTRVGGLPIERALHSVSEDIGPSSTPVAREVLSFDRIFYGRRDTTLEVEALTAEDKTLKATLWRRFISFPRRVVARTLPKEIGYIELTGFAPELEQDFESAIVGHQASRGLILDLRDNGGGFVNSVVRLASYFFEEETGLGVFVTRKGRTLPRRTHQMKEVYRRPVVVLVSARSASGAEMLAAALQEHRRARIVGTSASTCGCLVGVSNTIRLPDGGRLNVSDTDYRTGRGRRVEGAGIKPDHLVELRIADLLDGRDRALEWAVDYLSRAEGGIDSGLSTPRLNR